MANIPRFWYKNNPYASHFLDAFHLNASMAYIHLLDILGRFSQKKSIRKDFERNEDFYEYICNTASYSDNLEIPQEIILHRTGGKTVKRFQNLYFNLLNLLRFISVKLDKRNGDFTVALAIDFHSLILSYIHIKMLSRFSKEGVYQYMHNSLTNYTLNQHQYRNVVFENFTQNTIGYFVRISIMVSFSIILTVCTFLTGTTLLISSFSKDNRKYFTVKNWQAFKEEILKISLSSFKESYFLYFRPSFSPEMIFDRLFDSEMKATVLNEIEEKSKIKLEYQN